MKRADVVIIGGGVTGAGCLLEAASMGLACTLLEKGDYASGTTQASSRLIHGGIRYLEHFHFDLVAESLRERYWISQTFPHLLRPLAIHIPVYGWGKRSPIVAGLGVKLYDFLAGKMKIEESTIYFRDRARDMIPEISHNGLSGLFIFHDYQILMPERMVLENISAAEALGACSRNHTRVTDIEKSSEGYIVRGRDEKRGESISIAAEAVINASGAWTDEVRENAGFFGKLLRPTKGVHIEVEKLSDRALFVEAGTDRRLFFILPFLNHTVIGTTDTDFSGPVDEVRPLPEDIAYLMNNTNRIFRGISIQPSSVFSAYAGLRPLINVAGRKESAVPRRHRVVREGPGGSFISITGGKLTTFRKMARETVRKTMKALGRPAKAKSREAGFPCGKLSPEERERFTAHLTAEYGVEPQTAAVLHTVYGKGAEEVIKFAGSDPFLLSPLFQSTREIPAQILFAFERESATQLEDVMLRRMLIGKTPTKGVEGETRVREVLNRYLGMSEKDAEDAFRSYRESLYRRYLLNPGLMK